MCKIFGEYYKYLCIVPIIFTSKLVSTYLLTSLQKLELGCKCTAQWPEWEIFIHIFSLQKSCLFVLISACTSNNKRKKRNNYCSNPRNVQARLLKCLNWWLDFWFAVMICPFRGIVSSRFLFLGRSAKESLL